MARARTRIARWLATAALLCCACDGYSQGNSIDREITAAPGREMRVGVYSSIRPDAIRLPVAPEHATITQRPALRNPPKRLKSHTVCLSNRPAFVAFHP